MPITAVTTSGSGVALPEALQVAYTKLALRTAAPEMKYHEVFTELLDFGDFNGGDTIRIPSRSGIARGATVGEFDVPTPKSVTMTYKNATLIEYANSVAWSKRLETDSWFDVPSIHIEELSRDHQLVLQEYLRDVLVACGSEMFPNPAYTSYSDVTSTDILDISTIREATEYLADQKAPTFSDGKYVCYCTHHQLASIKKDPDWQSYSINTDNGERLRTGAVGEIDGVVFIPTQLQGNGRRSDPTDEGYEAALIEAGEDDLNLFRATIVGAQAVGFAHPYPMKFYVDAAKFDRSFEVAYFSRWAARELNTNFVAHLITA